MVPHAEKDALPHASEGTRQNMLWGCWASFAISCLRTIEMMTLFVTPDRSLSDVQESAQYLSGPTLPQLLLGGVLAQSEVASGSTILLCNLTSYDCCLEQVALTWNGEHSKDVRIKSLSLSSRTNISDYCARTMALQLLKDIKHMLF